MQTYASNVIAILFITTIYPFINIYFYLEIAKNG